MAVILLAIALTVLVIGGWGACELVFGASAWDLSAKAALAILLGAFQTSSALFIASLFLSGRGAVVLVTIINVAVALIALATRRRARQRIQWTLAATTTVLALFAVQAFVALWITHHRGIGWDGLFIWDMKARAFVMSDGRIPSTYFSDPTRRWSHQNYPLLLPLTETWTYLWVGTANQTVGKYVPLIFYFAAVGMLFSGGKIIAGTTVHGIAASLLPLFVPFVMMGEGSATSGYADFPIGAFYVAAVITLLLGREKQSLRVVTGSGIVAAALPWVKQEGLILWSAFMVLAAVVTASTFRERRFRSLAVTAAPGILVIAGWRLFLRAVDALNGGAFLPMTLHTAIANCGRLRPISGALIREMLTWRRWSLLWPVFLLAVFALWRAGKRTVALVLLVAVILPLPAYMFVYLFSAWHPFMNHVYGSLSRLILQLSPVAIVAVAAALPQLQPRHEID